MKIDLEALAARLRGVRESRNLKLREVSAQVAVSPATLSRIERGEAQPDLKTVQAVVAWLDLPLESFLVKSPIKRSSGSKSNLAGQATSALEQVELQFRADPNLPPDAAEALIKIVKTAYKQIVQTSRKA